MPGVPLAASFTFFLLPGPDFPPVPSFSSGTSSSDCSSVHLLGSVNCALRAWRETSVPSCSLRSICGRIRRTGFPPDLRPGASSQLMPTARVVAVFGGIKVREAACSSGPPSDEVGRRSVSARADIFEIGGTSLSVTRSPPGSRNSGADSAGVSTPARFACRRDRPPSPERRPRITPAFRQPSAKAYARAFSRALPEGLYGWPPAPAGTPTPPASKATRRGLGAIIETSTSAGGLITPKWIPKPCANISVCPPCGCGGSALILNRLEWPETGSSPHIGVPGVASAGKPLTFKLAAWLSADLLLGADRPQRRSLNRVN